MPVIPSLERLSHEDGEFEATLGYQGRPERKKTEIFQIMNGMVR
jgi:hypothetical protein